MSSHRFATSLRTLARRAAARRRLVLGVAAGFGFAAVLAVALLVETRARAADRQAFRAPSGSLAAFIDSSGNLTLHAALTTGATTFPAAAQQWIVRSNAGVVLATLDLRDTPPQSLGAMRIRGALFQADNLDAVAVANIAFVQSAADGRRLAVIDQSGNLRLRAHLFQNGAAPDVEAATDLIARPLVEAVRLDFAPSPSDAIAGYRVTMAQSLEGNYTAVALENVTWLGPTACICSGLTGGQTYYFRVRPLAEATAGSLTVGPESNTAWATPFTPCQQPWPEGWR